MNLYGVPRLTLDLDIIIELEEENLIRLLKALDTLNMRPRLPVNPKDLLNPEIRENLINNRNLTSFSFYSKTEPGSEIDIVIKYPLEFNTAFENRFTIVLKDFEVCLVSRDDLKTMKQSTGRKQDIADIEMLEIIDNDTNQT